MGLGGGAILTVMNSTGEITLQYARRDVRVTPRSCRSRESDQRERDRPPEP